MKKGLGWILKGFVSLLLLLALCYGAFHLWEYVTGSKYVRYLKEHSETVPLGENFSYGMISEDLDENKLILVGEIHGFKEPGLFDVHFFKYLHENHDVNHYIAEFDFVQASLLNDYLKSGDEALLADILKKWIVIQGRNNKDYFDKYRELHKYYVQLPDNDKFEVIGIDRIQDMSLTSGYLNGLAPSSPDSLKTPPPTQVDSLLSLVEMLDSFYSHSPDTLFILSRLKANLNLVKEKEDREEIMFKNFHELYRKYGLESARCYGFFGLFHIFQYRVNGQHPLASKIRMSDLGLADQILSINSLLNDSYMVTPSKQLPEFMRDKGKYTRMPVSADNILFVYIYGIKDFKRMTPEHHKSLIKMNAEKSPYSGSNRMNKTFQLLPVTDLFEMNDQGKPYIQYTLFVRNSDWAEPME